MWMPNQPVYVISKGRSDVCMTADFLVQDQVPFSLVVEPQERALYTAKYGEERVLSLPFSNLGLGSIPARNWVWEHAKALGHAKHWILDDNIRYIHRIYKGKRIVCSSGVAFRVIEDFCDRYTNIALSGMCYSMFAMPIRRGLPFAFINTHIYSCLLIDNALPYRWRGRYNEDTDLCLQVLSGGYCTVAFNMFCCNKTQTMSMKGGNSTQLYQGDGRLKMARSLERQWPYVVTTKRRFKRPQHVVRKAWQGFDTKLKRREGIDFGQLTDNEYGMRLTQVAPVRSEHLRTMLEESQGEQLERGWTAPVE